MIFGEHYKAKKGYVSFGCGSEAKIIIIPISIFSTFLSKMNMTDSKNKQYWHVKIVENDETLFLNQRHDNDIDLTEYVI